MNEQAPSDHDVRGIAALELSTALGARNRLIEEHAASFRWLIASLFAANGGALLALGGSEDVPAYAKLWACGWFTVGVFFALLTAWMNQKVIRKTLEPLSNLIAFWGAVAHGMEFDLNEHAKILDEAKTVTKRGWPVQVSGWAAALMFLFGMAVAGSGFWDHSEKQRISNASVGAVN